MIFFVFHLSLVDGTVSHSFLVTFFVDLFRLIANRCCCCLFFWSCVYTCGLETMPFFAFAGIVFSVGVNSNTFDHFGNFSISILFARLHSFLCFLPRFFLLVFFFVSVWFIPFLFFASIFRGFLVAYNFSFSMMALCNFNQNVSRKLI